MKSKLIFVSLLGLGILSLNFGCGGISKGGGSGCSSWNANAPNSITVAKGGFTEIDFQPGVGLGVSITGAELSVIANSFGISISQIAGNSFAINAAANTPSNVYTFEIQAFTADSPEDPCPGSNLEQIVITVP